MIKAIISTALVGGVVAGAFAQNVNAFKEATFTDLTVTRSGNTFTVTMGAHPTVDAVIGSPGPADIKNITGFWLLSDTGNLMATGADFGDYKFHTNTPGNGNDATFGYQTEQPHGLLPGQSQSFSFASISGNIDGYGFKLEAQGTPAHVRMGAQAVPEPASMAAIGLGVVGLLRRKRK